MVTRSHLQLVGQASDAGAAQTPPLSSAVAQNESAQRALDFVEPLYRGRVAASGEALVDHVLAVAETLSELKLDPDSITAALLAPAHALGSAWASNIRERFGTGV